MFAKSMTFPTALVSAVAIVSVLALPAPAMADNDALKKFLLIGAAALVVKSVIDNQQQSTPAPTQPSTTLTYAEVAALQHNLNRAGFYFGRVDGAFGNQTKTAAANWQRAYGYSATGMLTKDQRDQLQRMVSGGYYSASNSPIVTSQLPQQPVYGAALLTQNQLSTLQTDLQFLGYYSGLIDGVWGPRSQAALEHYRLAQDGNTNFNIRAQPGAIDLASAALSARELEQDITASLQQKLAQADH